MESDEAGCWQQKLAEPGSRSGVYTFPSTSTRQLCDMHTEGGGWTVGSHWCFKKVHPKVRNDREGPF